MLTLRIDRHLRMKEAQLCDALEIFASIREQRTYLGRWLPFVERTRCLNDTVVYLRSAAQAVPRHWVFTIRIGTDGQFGGLIGLRVTDPDGGIARIGCWLREEFQGQGIATRAVGRLCRHAFVEMGLQRIEVRSATRNLRGNRIPERLGFRLCRIEYRAELLSDGHRTNLKVYDLTPRPTLRRWLLHPFSTYHSLRKTEASAPKHTPCVLSTRQDVQPIAFGHIVGSYGRAHGTSSGTPRAEAGVLTRSSCPCMQPTNGSCVCIVPEGWRRPGTKNLLLYIRG